MCLSIREQLQFILDSNQNQNAICARGHSLSYLQLMKAIVPLISTIKSLPTNSGTVFPLITERSIDYCTGLVATILSGRSYHPLEYDEPSFPAIVIKLKESGYSHILTSAHLAPNFLDAGVACILIDDGSISNNIPFTNPTYHPDTLYIKSTSGITGRPKDVLIKSQNVIHYVQSLKTRIDLPENLQYTHVSNLGADLGNTSIFSSLFTGGCLHIVDDLTRKNPASFWEYIKKNKINFLKITPSHLEVLIGYGSQKNPCSPHILDYILLGGERFNWLLAEKLLNLNLTKYLYNHYGPTETTIGSSLFKVNPFDRNSLKSQTVPIGYPLGTTTYLLKDSCGKDHTSEGELYIGGPGVSQGYINNETQNKERFLTLENGHRYYKTGDLCVRYPDGNYEFICRMNDEVKVNGFRVDLRELEEITNAVDNIDYCKIFLHQDQLIGVIVKSADHLSEKELTEKLKEHLLKTIHPRFLPKKFIFINEMPLDKNGKFDIQLIKRNFSLNTNLSINTCIFEIAWRKILNLETEALNPNASFESHGGDSIQLIQLLAFLQSRGINIPYEDFLRLPTLDNLKKLSTKKLPSYDKMELSELKTLSPIQKWFMEQKFENSNHWNQITAYTTSQPIEQKKLFIAIKELLQFHPMLRLKLDETEPSTTYDFASLTDEHINQCVVRYDLSDLAEPDHNTFIQEKVNQSQDTIVLNKGCLIKFLVFETKAGENKLIIICHHFVIDMVSWRILIDSLDHFYHLASQPPQTKDLKSRYTYGQWLYEMCAFTQSKKLNEDIQFWENIPYHSEIFPSEISSEKNTLSCWINLDKVSKLSHFSSKGIKLQNVVLAAFIFAISKSFNLDKFNIDLESHGRAQNLFRTDLSNIIGWFTSLFPMNFFPPKGLSFIDLCSWVQDKMTRIPNMGIGFGIHKYMNLSLNMKSKSEFLFNFLGILQSTPTQFMALYPETFFPGNARGSQNLRSYKLVLTGKIFKDQLYAELSYDKTFFPHNTIQTLLTTMSQAIKGTPPKMIKTFISPNATGLINYIPSQIQHTLEAAPSKQRKYVLLTGATGFLGAYVLRDLLHTHINIDIVCLLRKKSGLSSKDRLRQIYMYYFPESELNLLEEVTVLEGDLSKKNLGLTEVTFRSLSSHLTDVIHIAADVRLMASFEEIYQTNIKGTQNILSLCQLSEGITLQYISTLSVAGTSPGITKVFSENDLDYGQNFLSSYEESKFQAEKYVRDWILSENRGNIYRTDNISADSKTCTFQKNFLSNRIAQTFNFYILTNIAPDLKDLEYGFTPVDIVSNAITTMVLKNVKEKTLHIETPWKIPHNQIIESMNRLGHKVKVCDINEYLEKLNQISESQSYFAPFWIRRELNRPRNVIYSNATSIEFLYSFGIEFPQPKPEWIDNFLRGIQQKSQSQKVVA